MTKQSKSIAAFVCALIAVTLTFVAPIAVQSISNPLSSSDCTKIICLFDGFAYTWLKGCLIVFGSGLIVSALVPLFLAKSEIMEALTRIFSILFLVFLVLAVVLAVTGFYQDTSILGTIKSNIGAMMPSVGAIIASVFSIVTVVLSFLR